MKTKKPTKQEKEVQSLFDRLNKVEYERTALIRENNLLTEKETGYRAVISYLENQLGLKDSMWGAK